MFGANTSLLYQVFQFDFVFVVFSFEIPRYVRIGRTGTGWQKKKGCENEEH